MSKQPVSAAANPTPPASPDDTVASISYTVAGRQFIVEPVFKNESQTSETLPSILLKLMLEQE